MTGTVRSGQVPKKKMIIKNQRNCFPKRQGLTTDVEMCVILVQMA